jgi:hypothetical protein
MEPRIITPDSWIGVDLDGTLAHYTRWRGEDVIGEPVPEMMDRVKRWVRNGQTVKIFTARASTPTGIAPVKAWLARHGLPDLEVTNQKDQGMIELWDDRCVEVVPNTGRPVNVLRRVVVD